MSSGSKHSGQVEEVSSIQGQYKEKMKGLA